MNRLADRVEGKRWPSIVAATLFMIALTGLLLVSVYLCDLPTGGVLVLSGFPTVCILAILCPLSRRHLNFSSVAAVPLMSMGILLLATRMLSKPSLFAAAPSAFVIPVLCGLSFFTAVLSLILFDLLKQKQRFKLAWFLASVCLGGLLVVSGGLYRRATFPVPVQLLQLLATVERSGSASPALQQERGVTLSMLGRQAEAEAIPTPFARQVPDRILRTIRTIEIPWTAWDQHFTDIASSRRLVIVMEAHNAPDHRRLLEGILPLFRQAGFRNYAAEGLSESGSALRRRGVATPYSGYYLRDPAFANLLRKAIQLDYRLHRYDVFSRDWEERERMQAETLSEIWNAMQDPRLLVHCGYGHVRKVSDRNGVPSMAGLLWEKTNTEPYCVLQLHQRPQDPVLALLSERVGPQVEPVVITPIPELIANQLTGYPKGSIDAMIVHPQTSFAADQRRPVIVGEKRRLQGQWTGKTRPVVIACYRSGDNVTAIPLDQVMLSNGETQFELWSSEAEVAVRVFSREGEIKATEERLDWSFRPE